MAPSKKARYENDKEHAADSKFDLKRLAIAFGLAGVDRRSLIEEAAKSELSLVRHALLLRRLVLRYMKALIAIIITACTSYLVIAILSAKIDGISDRATALILIGFVYQGWGLATALLVRLPIFWIWGRYIPSARRSDAAKDPHLVRFEWFVYAFSIITVLLATCFIITESKQHGYPFPIWAATILALISITIMIVLFLKQLSSHSVSAQKNRDLA